MAIKIPQKAFESQNIANASNSPVNRLNHLLDQTKDLSLKKNGTLFISYQDMMRVSMELWVVNENTSMPFKLKFDDTPASEELIQALIYVMFNDIEELKKIIPTLADKPVESNDLCLDLCLDFVCTNLKRKKNKSQLSGIPHFTCSFYVPEKDSKDTSSISIYVRETEANRDSLAGFYDGVDSAIHL